jgi:hypothetical protein
MSIVIEVTLAGTVKLFVELPDEKLCEFAEAELKLKDMARPKATRSVKPVAFLNESDRKRGLRE